MKTKICDCRSYGESLSCPVHGYPTPEPSMKMYLFQLKGSEDLSEAVAVQAVDGDSARSRFAKYLKEQGAWNHGSAYQYIEIKVVA